MRVEYTFDTTAMKSQFRRLQRVVSVVAALATTIPLPVYALRAGLEGTVEGELQGSLAGLESEAAKVVDAEAALKALGAYYSLEAASGPPQVVPAIQFWRGLATGGYRVVATQLTDPSGNVWRFEHPSPVRSALPSGVTPMGIDGVTLSMRELATLPRIATRITRTPDPWIRRQLASASSAGMEEPRNRWSQDRPTLRQLNEFLRVLLVMKSPAEISTPSITVRAFLERLIPRMGELSRVLQAHPLPISVEEAYALLGFAPGDEPMVSDLGRMLPGFSLIIGQMAVIEHEQVGQLMTEDTVLAALSEREARAPDSRVPPIQLSGEVMRGFIRRALEFTGQSTGMEEGRIEPAWRQDERFVVPLGRRMSVAAFGQQFPEFAAQHGEAGQALLASASDVFVAPVPDRVTVYRTETVGRRLDMLVAGNPHLVMQNIPAAAEAFQAPFVVLVENATLARGIPQPVLVVGSEALPSTEQLLLMALTGRAELGDLPTARVVTFTSGGLEEQRYVAAFV